MNKKTSIPILSLFILVQIFIILMVFDRVNILGSKVIIGDNSKLHSGRIVFSGNMQGVFGLTGCGRSRGSLSRRAFVLKALDDYLYLELGNFTSNSLAANRIGIPLIMESFRYMKVNAFNLTAGDLKNAELAGSQLLQDRALSTNIELSTPQGSNGNFAKFKVVPFKLSNDESEISINVGICGIAATNRNSSRHNLRIKKNNAKASIDALKPHLDKTDLKILLYEDRFTKLETLLPGIQVTFDLVIAPPTLLDQEGKTAYIGDTPVFFLPDEKGKSLGHITVYKNNSGGFLYEFDEIFIFSSFPEDIQMKRLTKLYAHKINEYIKERKKNEK